ncbi:pyridoxamine 5'-phosphate oxidase family protein [Thiorhodococcus fuscus]|uniref:Pyridoxamine 5'-phosphate oxidase family protein n=1 Tax=Thiorhodococcus fuscus TaxID=527200 RepID=A0ABW4YDS1_9GAMM
MTTNQPQSARHPHAAMRRSDREITERAEIDAIIQSTRVMNLALSDANTPFVVPIFYAYDGRSLFIHSAKGGSKIGIMRRNDKVCFAISVDQGFIESDQACDFEAKHRTVIGFGRACFIEDEAEKIAALDRIVARFSEHAFTYPKTNLDATAVIRIEIESIKGKSHGFG